MKHRRYARRNKGFLPLPILAFGAFSILSASAFSVLYLKKDIPPQVVQNTTNNYEEVVVTEEIQETSNTSGNTTYVTGITKESLEERLRLFKEEFKLPEPVVINHTTEVSKTVIENSQMDGIFRSIENRTNTTTVGNLDSGSITTGFGDINIGQNTLTALNANFTYATSTNATSTSSYVSGTFGLNGDYFTDLSGGGLTLTDGVLSVTGLTSSTYSNMATSFDATGNLIATSTPSFSTIIATSTTATSTFAGGVNIGSGGLVYDYSSGRVGIGTLTPESVLSISQNDNADIWLKEFNSDVNPPNLIFASSRGTSSSPSSLVNNDGVGRILFKAFGDTDFKNTGYIGIHTEGGTTDSSSAGRIFFATTPVNSTTPEVRMIIEEDGKFGFGDMNSVNGSFFHIQQVGTSTNELILRVQDDSSNSIFMVAENGNVGIWDTTPTYKLDVTGNARFTSFVDASHFVATSTSATSTFAGGLTVDGTDFVVDPDGGRVGIGTASPGSIMDITAYSPRPRINLTGTNSYGALDFTEAGSIGASLLLVGSLSATVDERSDLQLWSDVDIGFFAGNSQTVTFKSGGNVGIGTTSPVSKLSVVGNSAFAGSASVGLGYAGTSAPSNGMIIQGNVGIGTTGPTEPLHVHNATLPTIKLTTTNSGLTSTDGLEILADTGGNGYLFNRENAPLIFGTNNTEQVRITSTGNVGIGTTTPVDKLSVVGNSAFAGSASVGLGYAGTSAPSNGMIIEGNVGIGTSGPDKKLTIGAGVVNQTVGMDDSGIYLSRTLDGAYIGSIKRSAGSTANAVGWHYDGNSSLTHQFTTSGVVVATIGTARGTIGTTGILSVDTISEIRSLNGLANYPITLLSDDQSAGSNGIVFNRSNRTTAGNNAVTVWQYAGTELGRFTTSGNIGIGTTTPWGKLSVKGGGTSTGKAFAVSDSSDVTRFVVQDDGKVGVGIGVPTAALDVVGSLKVTPSGGNAILTGANNSRATLNIGSYLNIFDADITVLDNQRALGMSIRMNGSEKVKITGAGNVGIGTTTPVDKLSVVGNSAFAGSASVGLGYAGTSAPSNGMIIQGNVGIGTTSPLGRLHVATANSGGSVGAGADEFVIEGTSGIGMTFLASDSSTQRIAFASPSDAEGASIKWDYDDALLQVGTWRAGGETALLYANGAEGLRINSTGNVGIGTTTPVDKLSVVGNSAFAGSASVGLGYAGTSAPSNGMIIQGNVGIGTTTPWGKLSVKGGGTSTGKAFAVSDSSNVTRFVVQDDGNVGIGTSAPDVTLDVRGALQVYHGASNKIETVGRDTNIIGILGNDTNYIINFETAQQKFSVGGSVEFGSKFNVAGNASIGTGFDGTAAPSNGMIIEGNVGIGTTGPDAPLTVNGDISLATTTSNIHFRSNGFGAYIQSNGYSISNFLRSTGQNFRVGVKGTSQTLDLRPDDTNTWKMTYGDSAGAAADLIIGTTAGGGVDALTIKDTGNVGIGTTSPVSKLSVVGNSAFAGSASVGLGYAGTSAPSNGMIVEGNVGIGTSSPSQKLSVNGAALIAISNTKTTDLSSVLHVSRGGATGLVLDDTSQVADSRMWQVRTDATKLHFAALTDAASVSEKVTIQRDGKVGIGTTAPTAKIHVLQSGSPLTYSNVSFAVQSTSGASSNVDSALTAGTTGIATLAFGDSDDIDMGRIRYNNNLDAFGLWTAAVERLSITNTGNVGIGTTTPWGKLSVKGGGTSTGKAFAVSDSSNVTRFVIEDAGNVGVGTTSPTETLTVSSADPSLSLYSTDSTELLRFIGTGGANYIQSGAGRTTGSSADLHFTDVFASNTWLTIKSDGKVGIGTTTPVEKLQVNGNIAPNTDDIYDLGTATYRWDDVYATNGTIQTSDERHKENIENMSYGLDTIVSLRPVTYDWKKNKEDGRQLGLIAQEVLKVLPEAVDVGDDSEKTLGLRYTNFIPVIIKSIQELNEKVDKLLANAGQGIKNGMGIFSKLKVGDEKQPTTITVFDKYGKEGCMVVNNVEAGSFRVVPGSCDEYDGLFDKEAAPVVEVVEEVVSTTTPVVIEEEVGTITPEVIEEVTATSTEEVVEEVVEAVVEEVAEEVVEETLEEEVVEEIPHE